MSGQCESAELVEWVGERPCSRHSGFTQSHGQMAHGSGHFGSGAAPVFHYKTSQNCKNGSETPQENTLQQKHHVEDP